MTVGRGWPFRTGGPRSIYEEGGTEGRRGAETESRLLRRAVPGRRGRPPCWRPERSPPLEGAVPTSSSSQHQLSQTFSSVHKIYRFIPTVDGLQGKETHLSDSDTVRSDRATTRNSGGLGSGWSAPAEPGCAALVKAPPSWPSHFQFVGKGVLHGHFLALKF